VVVEQKLANKDGAPIGEKQDAAFVGILANNYGVIQGVPDKEGRVIPTAIVAPERFAGFADAAGRVPADVAGLIQRGMAGDIGQVGSAAQALAALQSQNPALAEQVISGMTPKAMLRARELQSKVDAGLWSKAAGDGAEQLAQNLQTNGNTIRAIANMQYQPLPREEMRKAIYGPDAQTQEATKQKIIKESFTVAESEWLRFSDYAPTLNMAQRGEFFDMVEQEYQTALARTGSDQQALSIAKTKAAERFAASHQQVVWNGMAITSDAPRQLENPEDFSAAVAAELKSEGWTDGAIAEVLTTTVPKWNKQQKVWTFIDQFGDPFTYNTPTDAGKLLGVSLIKGDGKKTKYSREQVDALKKKVEDFKKNEINWYRDGENDGINSTMSATL
jgi:hypothetical protein